MLDLLRWAAGCDRKALPGLESQDWSASPEEILHAFTMHRLTNRLARRLREPDAVQLAAETRDLVFETAARVEDKVHRTAKEISRIQSAARWQGSPVVFKGSVAYFLTTGGAPPRHSGDIDLMPRSVSEFVPLLADLGYVELNHAKSWHDAGYFALGDGSDKMVIDLHHYFPVFGYPKSDAVDLTETSKWIDIGPVEDCESILYSEIHYVDIVEEMRDIEAAGQLISLPSPELAALAACTHIFRNTLLWPWPRPYGTFRLGELADTVSLVGLKTFDAGKFAALVQRFRAEDAVHFVAHTVGELLGPVPRPLSRWLPEKLPGYWYVWEDGEFPTVLRTSEPLATVGEFAVRQKSMGEFIDRLGPTSVTAGTEQDGMNSMTLDRETSTIRLISHRRGSTAIAGEISLSWLQGAAEFRMDLTSADARMNGMLLHFGESILEMTHSVADGQVRTKNLSIVPNSLADNIQVTHESSADGSFMLRVQVPFDAPGIDFRESWLPVVFGVRRKGGEFGDGVTLLAPLRVLRPT
jgi:hypothetical protein